jgi:hypothetical protein
MQMFVEICPYSYLCVFKRQLLHWYCYSICFNVFVSNLTEYDCVNFYYVVHSIRYDLLCKLWMLWSLSQLRMWFIWYKRSFNFPALENIMHFDYFCFVISVKSCQSSAVLCKFIILFAATVVFQNCQQQLLFALFCS